MATQPGKRFGKAYVTVDGTVLESKPGAKCNPGGPKKTTVVGNHVHGYSEEEMPSHVEVSRFIDAGFSVDAIRNADTVKVAFECDSGQVYTGDMWFTEIPDLESANDGGSANYVLEGPPLQEVK